MLHNILNVETYYSPADWAGKKRRLGNDSYRPGLFDPNLTPYFLPIYDAFMRADIKKITVCCGSQMGKTDFLLNLAGYILDVAPQTVMIVEPTQSLAESISGDRFKKMALSAGIRQDTNKQKVTEKFYNGTKVLFAWASSASQLVSHPVSCVLMDERDQMPDDVDRQGDPYALALARTETYPNAKIVCASTPTKLGASAIMKLVTSSCGYRWCVPCASCEKFYVPELDIFNYDVEKHKVVDAWLRCPLCGSKNRTIENGKFEQFYTGADNHLGFWISGLVSPFRTLKQSAQRHYDAKRDSDRTLKTVVNTVFGECYEEINTKIDVTMFDSIRCAPPQDAYTRIIGVDVQKDRLYYVTRVWNAQGISYMEDFGFFSGDTDLGNVWEALRQYVIVREPRLVFVDSGYRTFNVYKFVDSLPRLAYSCKGARSITSTTRKVQRDAKYGLNTGNYTIQYDDTFFKDSLNAHIRSKQFYVLPSVNEEYLSQMTAEEYIIVKGKGRWESHDRPNHYYDAEKLVLVAHWELQRSTPTQQGFSVINKGANVWGKT